MDLLQQEEDPFGAADPLDIFDEELLSDPEHPKLICEIRADETCFPSRVSENDEHAEWSLWQQFLLLIGLLVVTYAWHVMLLTARQSRAVADETSKTVSIRLQSRVEKKPLETLDANTPDLNDVPAIEEVPQQGKSSVPEDQVATEKLEDSSVAPRPKQSVRRSIRAYIDELNKKEVYSVDGATPTGVPLNSGTVVFDSSLKAKLQSAYVAEINAQNQSSQKDVYRNVHGDEVSRSGTLCATTIRNPGIGEWTYYSACLRPRDKLRRFGNEVNSSGAVIGRPEN